jgi:hypothetical protein
MPATKYKKKDEAVQSPECAREYNKYMNKVDIRDQLSGGRYALEQQIVTQRWSLKVMLSIMATAMTQAFVHYKVMKRGVSKNYVHYKFLRRLMWLMLKFDEKRYLRRKSKLAQGLKPDPADCVGPEPHRTPTPQTPAAQTPAAPATPTAPRAAEASKGPGTHRMAELETERPEVCRVCSDRVDDPLQQSPLKIVSKRSTEYTTWIYCPGCPGHMPMHPWCFTRVPAHNEPGYSAHSNPASQAQHLLPSPNRAKSKSRKK